MWTAQHRRQTHRLQHHPTGLRAQVYMRPSFLLTVALCPPSLHATPGYQCLDGVDAWRDAVTRSLCGNDVLTACSPASQRRPDRGQCVVCILSPSGCSWSACLQVVRGMIRGSGPRRHPSLGRAPCRRAALPWRRSLTRPPASPPQHRPMATSPALPGRNAPPARRPLTGST